MKFIPNTLHEDERGILSAIDNLSESVFSVERFYLITETKVGQIRGNHAHRKAKQLLTCVSGEFKIYLHDGKEKQEISLKEKYPSLFIDEPTWLQFEPVIDKSILLICSNITHDRSEYIHDFNEFLQLKGLL